MEKINDKTLFRLYANNDIVADAIDLDLSKLTEEQKNQFFGLINQSKVRKIWKPKIGEQIWYICPIDGICAREWEEFDNCKPLFHAGNYYKTRKEAEFALEKLYVECEMRKYIEENDTEELDFNNKDQIKCSLLYDLSLNGLSVAKDKDSIYQGIYFSNSLDSDAMIEAIGEDRIKKYIFGVE